MEGWPRAFATLVFGAVVSSTLAEPLYVVRVGLTGFTSEAKLRISANSGFAAYDAANQRRLGVYAGGAQVTVQRTEDGLVGIAGTRVAAIYFAAEDSILTVSGGKGARTYRGWLFVGSSPNGLYAVNEVPLEDYLLGVLPCEISPSAPLEAIKAQAIAARSYTIRKIGRFKDQPYDVDDTVRTQVYRGVEKEDPRTTAAVRATAGQLLTYNGVVVDAIYGAVSGGQTENCHEVWGGSPVPYLTSFPDVDERGRTYAEGAKHMTWAAAYSPEELESLLRAGGYSLGTIVEVLIAARTSSGRAAAVQLVGTHGKASIKANDLRWILGVDRLRSTWFNVGRTSAGWEFAGRGWGHGVGMCQEGAIGRAKAGQNYAQILAAYYPGTQIQVVRGDPLALPTRGSVVDRKRFSR